MNQPVRRRSRAWTVAVMGAVIVAVAAVAPPFGIAGGQQGGDTTKAPPTVNAVVVNGSEQPVPVAGTVTVNSGSPLAVAPPPLWQGTPYVASQILTTLQSFTCANLPAVPEGKILFVERAITSFNTAPGQSGSASVSFTVVGSASATSVTVPVTRAAPAAQVAGLYDGYQGSVEIGVPAAAGAVQICFGAVSGSDVSGKTTVIGYLVPAA